MPRKATWAYNKCRCGGRFGGKSSKYQTSIKITLFSIVLKKNWLSSEMIPLTQQSSTNQLSNTGDQTAHWWRHITWRSLQCTPSGEKTDYRNVCKPSLRWLLRIKMYIGLFARKRRLKLHFWLSKVKDYAWKVTLTSVFMPVCSMLMEGQPAPNIYTVFHSYVKGNSDETAHTTRYYKLCKCYYTQLVTIDDKTKSVNL